jgi:transposase-like protein
MARQRLKNLSPTVVQEILQLYESRGASATEIAQSYGLHDSSFYRLLQAHGVTPLNRRNGTWAGRTKEGKVQVRKISQEEFETVAQDATVVAPPQPLAVVVDGQGMVQEVHHVVVPRNHNLSTWEIKYTGVLLVEAESIDQALNEARKISTVRRIYSARITK